MSDKPQQKQHVLGVPTDNIAGLSVDEIYNNKTAVTMLFHYYKQVNDENVGLKNDRNTLQTYVAAYENKKSDSATASFLFLASNVVIAFAVNFITGGHDSIGWVTLIPGVVMSGVGFYLQFFKDRIK
ncbi:hypothetical protein [Pseudobdellovibrio sp. HCB154]|uniref:hypothetical protein n=1 Tax=Pseudobdellovibrio sp. HCB154 TaxID=3386277 RepID=UPI0039175E8E